MLGEQLASRINQHFSKAQTAKENLRRAVKSQSLQLTGYQSCLNLFARLREQDARVLALLEEYRNTLLGKGKRETLIFKVNDVTKISLDTQRVIKGDEYAGMAIELRYV